MQTIDDKVRQQKYDNSVLDSLNEKPDAPIYSATKPGTKIVEVSSTISYTLYYPFFIHIPIATLNH